MSLNRSKAASILKDGRKGNGIQGSIMARGFGLGGQHLQSNKVSSDFGVVVAQSDTPADAAFTGVVYDNSQRQFTFTKSPVGGSGSALALGSVMGGNASPTTPVATADPDNTNILLDEQGYTYDTAYPTVRPFSYPLPVIVNGLLRTLPRVKNWNKFYLDTTYSFGDKLPRCPDGVCYVRVERPFTLGDAAWNSSFTEGVYTPSTEDFPQIVAASMAKGSFSTVYLYYDKDCTLNPVMQLIKVAAVSSVDDNARPSVSVSSYAIDLARRAVKLTLSRALDPTIENATVAVPKGLLQYGRGPVELNPYTELDITYSGDSFSMCFAINRNAVQGFGFGDLVLLKSSPVSITDEWGVTVGCFEIIAPAGPAVPTHSHQSAGGGRYGGGPSLITPVV